MTVPAPGPVMVSVAGADSTAMVTGPVVVSCGLLESVAVTVTVDVPATVGVPLITQPMAVRPAGKVPLTIVQLYGPLPPVTPMVPV